MPRKSGESIRGLADAVQGLREQFADGLDAGDVRLWELFERYRDQAPAEAEPAEFAAVVTETLVAASLVAAHHGPLLRRSGALPWLMAQVGPVAGQLIGSAFAVAEPAGDRHLAVPAEVRQQAHRWRDRHRAARGTVYPLLHFYEELLAAVDRRRRQRRGVYLTPVALARYVVRQVDAALRDEFGLPLGLADTSTWGELGLAGAPLADRPFVRVLDPAVGTGVFLVEAIEHIRSTCRAAWCRQGLSAAEQEAAWRRYVQRHLLTRLSGFEIQLAPQLVCQLVLACQLAAQGCRFSASPPLDIRHCDALAEPGCGDFCQPYTVIVGNPPFSGISQNRGRWIRALLKGKCADPAGQDSYYHLGGRRLDERKVWLDDDYVKFFRFGQWCVRRAGCGVVGLVTNHGYLDNTTFRGMRESLLSAFPRITLIDLHGNRKRHELAADGAPDENLFGIEQGVAIGLLRRLPRHERHERAVRVERSDLLGRRQEKLRILSNAGPAGRLATGDSAKGGAGLVFQRLEPHAPHYLFTPADAAAAEFSAGLPLPEIMPVGTTAPVTARDHLVVGFETAELLERLTRFADLGRSDAEIRRQFFPRPRSSRYLPGDTRGWRVDVARRRLAAEGVVADHVQRCLYRPFDVRSVYWVDWMIDWPRCDVTRHLLAGPNLSLVTRRQMLPGHECNFFWVSDRLALDGVIRSDNRGSESLFPTYVYEADGTRRGNFAPGFVRQLEQHLGCRWRECRPRPGTREVEPADVTRFAYAQFNSPTYRRRYADALRREFPRLFLPSSWDLFRRLADAGRRLVQMHCSGRAARSGARPAFHGASGPHELAAGYPRFDGRVLQVHRHAYFSGVGEDDWTFKVGAHQVCRKWLRDRRKRPLSAACLERFADLVAVLRATREIRDEIEAAVEDHGGWLRAFPVQN